MYEQWKHGMQLLSYALEAQLTGAKTMAFYEEENREQRAQAEITLQKKYDLEDQCWQQESVIHHQKQEIAALKFQNKKLLDYVAPITEN